MESILSQATETTTGLTLEEIIFCTLTSIILGFLISFVYIICNKKYSKNYIITLVILPILVQAVIMMVNGNLGTGVAIMGAFNLVRFRSIPGSSKEIGVIFLTMAVGLATGMGYISFALLIAITVSLILVLLTKLNYGGSKEIHKNIKILLPENIDFTHLFEDLLSQYTSSYQLDKIRTTNMGSMFELTYDVILKKDKNEKELIDEIRCRNGNLTVSIAKPDNFQEEL